MLRNVVFTSKTRTFFSLICHESQPIFSVNTHLSDFFQTKKYHRRKQITYIHDKVPQCLSPRPNWDPPIPRATVLPHPAEPKGGGHTRLRLSGSQFGRREKRSILSQYEY
jgi:hypothetical protein